jgi:hypothetical protein
MLLRFFNEVSSGKELFYHAVQKYKKVPAPHFLDLQVGSTMLSVGPAIGYYRKAIAPYHSL